METTSSFDLIGTVNDEEEKKNVVHSTTAKPIINFSLETEDNFETTHQNTDKVLVFIQICMGLIAIFCIIFGGVVLWQIIKPYPNISEFTTTIDIQVSHEQPTPCQEVQQVRPVPTPRTKRKSGAAAEVQNNTTKMMRPHGGHWLPPGTAGQVTSSSTVVAAVLPEVNGVPDVHNTSQDSGLGPSPFFLQSNGGGGQLQQQPRSSGPQGQACWGRTPEASQLTIGSDFATPTLPPPLPPKKRQQQASNVFSPTLMVKTPSASYGNYYNNHQPPSLPPNTSANNYNPRTSMECIRTQDFIPVRPEVVMQKASTASPSLSSNNSTSMILPDHNKMNLKRLQHRNRREAQRNSMLIFSSDEEEDCLKLRQNNGNLQNSPQNINFTENFQNTVVDANNETEIVIMNEPFPPELDFAQITGQTDFRPSMPPPPPPRDPKRRLYLSGSPSCQIHNQQQHRPVSYAFEKPDVVQNPQPGRPRAASAIVTSAMLPRPRSSSSSNTNNAFVAQSHVYPSHRILPETPPEVVRSPRRSIVKEEAAKQGNRASSASSYFRYSSFPDLVQPQMEYWKSPPPPFVPTFDPNLVKEEEIELPPPPRPPRPNLRKKLSNTSNDSRGRDSAIGSTFGPSPLLPSSGQLGGKSSPSSSSVTSKDSGIHPEIPTLPQLPALLETRMNEIQNSTITTTKNILCENDNSTAAEDTEDQVEVIPCITDNDNEESATESCWTPPDTDCAPRTDENHPGFSSKTRRSLFRAAINEIEDAFKLLSADADLLDRAERRDLPTAHQELIAQSRSNTSLNTSTEMIFSDMDNFMNWNTSSSFENIPERGSSRQRTPSSRRSGVPDKTKDDMVYRICRDNNKVVGGDDPGVKMNQSYLLLSPAMTPASSISNVVGGVMTPNIDYFGNIEPDVHHDDVHLRTIRDSQGSSKNIPDQAEPPFGIPKIKCISGASEKDYLHAVPDPNRYKSTFNASKKPNTVLDDLAYRALRKDDNVSDPKSLGIIKDPNAIPHHSCWKHKMESQMNKPEEVPAFPAVFYPNRNHKLLQTLAKDISNVIRKQSATPGGGQDSKLVTYDDLLKDPDVMISMKKALDIQDAPMINGDENDEIMPDGRPRWAGKTLYELFKTELDNHEKVEKTNQPNEGQVKKDGEEHDNMNILKKKNSISISDEDSSMNSTSSPSPPPLSEPQNVLTIQHLVIEQDHPPMLEQLPHPMFIDDNNNNNDDKEKFSKNQTTWISQTLVEDETSSHLRNLQRCDSESPTTTTTEEIHYTAGSVLPDPISGSAAGHVGDCTISGSVHHHHLDHPVLPIQPKQEDLDRDQGMNCVLAWLDHPGMLALLYCLALLQQLNGQLGGQSMDFLSLLGIVLAILSMMTMFFI